MITHLEQVTPGWLTDVLAHSGALIQGSVAACDVEPGRGNWSTNARLRVRYAQGSQGNLPQHLFLKMVATDLKDSSFGPSEVTYYTRDYGDVPDAPLVRCYDADYSADAQRYHVLLDDLSQSHITAADKPVTLGYGLALAEGLAALHARWWGEARLAEIAAPVPAPEQIHTFVQKVEPGIGYLLDLLSQSSEETKPHWPDAVRQIFASHPQAMIDRTQHDSGFTLVHSDVGEQNILVPRHGDRPIYIIDRQPFAWSLTTWLGVYDLAYTMVLDWDVETRRGLEMAVLRHYHDQLIRRGVNGYSWAVLVDDYRLCVAMGVYVAAENGRDGLDSPWVSSWMSMLQRSLIAMDDLNCYELWPE